MSRLRRRRAPNLRLDGQRRSGEVGPGRKPVQIYCDNCGDPLGMGVLRPGEIPSCAAPECERAARRLEEGEELIEGGEHVRG
jgi:hypothetical protein